MYYNPVATYMYLLHNTYLPPFTYQDILYAHAMVWLVQLIYCMFIHTYRCTCDPSAIKTLGSPHNAMLVRIYVHTQLTAALYRQLYLVLRIVSSPSQSF